MAARPDDCIFCKIAAGELRTQFVAESERVVVFDDISPAAPVHLLVVPKRHVESARDLSGQDGDIWAEMLALANRAADARGVRETGYRLVTNAGPDSGQEVPHLHLHVLGGRKLGPLG